MSSSLNRIKKNIIEAMQSSNNQGTSAYDSVAEVRRVDGDTAWVHIAGGVDETPVKLTIAAKAGDTVQVRVGGGRAWITGNASAPPTDDHMANTANTTAKTANVTANQALQGANTAQNTADKAQNTATEAAKTADNYISTDSTGIMVSENNGATKETPSNATKNNVLITEKDVQIRNGKKVVASYGETSTIGATDGKNMRVSGTGTEIRDGDKVLATYGPSEIILGDLSGDNILLEKARMAIRAGAAEKMAIESTKTTTIVTENHFFDGARVDDTLAPGGTYMNRWTLNNPVNIKKVRIRTDSGKVVGSGTYSWSIYGSETLQIVISGDSQEAMAVDWSEYTTLEVTYESGFIVSNVKCDKFEAKDNAGKFVSFTEISSGTGTATADTGRVTTQPNWWRCGNLVQLEFGVAATAAVNPGKNIATGTITGIPRPVTTIGLRSVSFYGNNANVTLVSKDGAFTVRNCGSDALAKGNDASGIFTYITDGTFTGGGA